MHQYLFLYLSINIKKDKLPSVPLISIKSYSIIPFHSSLRVRNVPSVIFSIIYLWVSLPRYVTNLPSLPPSPKWTPPHPLRRLALSCVHSFPIQLRRHAGHPLHCTQPAFQIETGSLTVDENYNISREQTWQ